MNRQRLVDFWCGIESRPLWWLASIVFLFALSARLLVTLFFFLRWGWHTVSGIELWFYYGVAKGTFGLYSHWDPTWWILRMLGHIFRGEALLYSVYLCSSIHSSFNSAFLAFFVCKLHDKKTGFLAGLLYSSMVLPMFNTAGTITHDIFAWPYFILLLLAAVLAVKGRSLFRWLWLAAIPAAFFLGVQVGPSILVAAGALVVFLLWEAVAAIGGERLRRGWRGFAVFMAVMTGLVALLHFFVMPDLMEWMFDQALRTRGVDVRAQIQAGSGDLLSTSFGDYWLRFNYLIFFLPMGVWAVLKKKDAATLGLLLFGVLAALAADRGTRPLTIGFALMGAVVFTNWENWFDFALPALMGLAIGVMGGRYTLEYAVFFPAAALFIYFSLRWPLPGGEKTGHWVAGALSLLWLAAGGILGGVTFQARGRGDGALIESVGRYWTIRLCVLLPVAVWLLHSFWRGFSLGKERKWIKNRLGGYLYVIVVVLGLLLFLVPFPELWKRVHFIVPPLAAVAGAIALWPDRLRTRGRFYWGPVAVFWLFAVIIPSMNQTPKSSESEYRLYRWLEENAPESPGKIFVPWSDGFFAQAVSGVPSELSPERINFQLPLIYWMPEEKSFRFLKAQGIEYIMVSSKYFKLLAYNSQTGEYQYIFSPDIIHRPESLGLAKLSDLQEATLFQLLYNPGNLKYYRLLREEWSDLPRREFYRLYELAN